MEVNGHKIVAIGVWLMALSTTYLFIAGLGASWYVSIGMAILIQALLTFLEHMAFGGSRDPVAWAGVIADVFVNIGGLWPILSRIHSTPSYQAIAEAVGTSSGPMPDILRLAAAIILATLLAMAPERLWRE